MAVDLAKLVARLELQSGQFQSELVKANRKLAAFDTDVRKIGRGIAGGFKGLFAGIGIGLVVKKIVDETSQANAAVAQLTNALERNGGAAGQTAPQLVAMANKLQTLTTYSDESVMSMQALLLRFRGIGGPEFQRAQTAILDLSSALGIDLATATKSFGKALENPLKGMTALGRLGLKLSDDQQALVKSFMDSGQAAKAQAVLLGEVEKRYGGAAAAAKNTLGGALTGLGNAFGDLFEISDKGSSKAIEAVNELTETLSSDETKKALDTLTGAFATFFGFVVQGLAKVVNGVAKIPSALQDAAAAQARTGAMRFGTPEQQRAALENRTQYMTIAGGNRGRRKIVPEGTVEEIKQVTVALEEFDVQVERLQSNPLADYFDQLNDSTKTSAEKTVDQINQLEAALAALQREGIINADTANTRRQAGLDELLPAFDIAEIQKKRIVVEKEIKALNEYEVAAARESQQLIATSIRDAFTGSFDEIPKRFQELLLDLIIQAQAAKIGTYLFGDTGSGGSTGGALSGILGAFFGGGKAMGGAVYAGQAYMVGERGPEMFVPPTAGRIEPNRNTGGTTVINVGVRADGGEVSRPTRLALGATVARAIGRANVRNN